MKRLLVFVLLTAACGGSSTPTTPAPVAVAACQANNTATIFFQNNSTSGTTYDVIFDGSKFATVSPAQATQSFTVASGVQHTLVWLITNTNLIACTASTPVVAQCSTGTFSCAR